MGARVEQVAPKVVPGEIGSHEWVIRDLRFCDLPPDLFAAVYRRIRAREAVGLETYGTLLQPGNGRDSMRDAWEETVDQVVYLANAIREGAPVHGIYTAARDVMLEIVAYMDGAPSTPDAKV